MFPALAAKIPVGGPNTKLRPRLPWMPSDGAVRALADRGSCYRQSKQEKSETFHRFRAPTSQSSAGRQVWDLRCATASPRPSPVMSRWSPRCLRSCGSSDSPERGCRTALGSRSTTGPISPSVTSECDDAAAIDALSRFAGDQLIKDRAGDRAQ
jgi:hypothetical protein